MTGSSERVLSALEGVCLGIVCKSQPCTAYRVRGGLREAPSSHWRASAGSVYPLLARLEEHGLVSSRPDKADGRGRKLLKITKNGQKSLKQWVMAGADDKRISLVPDPIRSRTFFLDVLKPAQQIELMKDLIARMENYLLKMQAHLESQSESEDLYAYLGALGAMRITEARLDWLKLVHKRLLK